MKSNIRIFKGTETKAMQHITITIYSTSKIYEEIKQFATRQGTVYYGSPRSNNFPSKEIVIDFLPSSHPRMTRPYKPSTNTTVIKFSVPVNKKSPFLKKIPFHPDESKVFIKENQLHIPLVGVASEKKQQTSLKLDEQWKDELEAKFKCLPDLVMAKMLNDETFISKLANTIAFKLRPEFTSLQQSQDDALQELANKLINYWEEPTKKASHGND